MYQKVVEDKFKYCILIWYRDSLSVCIFFDVFFVV